MQSICSHKSSSPPHFLVKLPQRVPGMATSSVLVRSVAVGAAMTMEKRVAMRIAIGLRNTIVREELRQRGGFGWGAVYSIRGPEDV
jgi:hypothetical protein